MIDPKHETDTGLLASLAREQVKLRSRMRGLDGPKAAATFGGLLTDPRLHADSDDAASLFRNDAARHSGMIAPPG